MPQFRECIVSFGCRSGSAQYTLRRTHLVELVENANHSQQAKTPAVVNGIRLKYGSHGQSPAQISEENGEENPLSKIARRQFMQLSAVAAAGLVVAPGREASAQDMPHIEESDPVAQSLKYTHDASSVDPASRANPAADQHCANCALIQGNEGDEWRPCQIFPGKLVKNTGWCSVWAPKA
jgi:hypothetical protein